MNFDESKFLSLLSQVNATSISQKQLANYMLYYIDDQPKLSPLWETEILQTPQQEKRLFLFQVSNAVIVQSYRHSQTVYQQSFALFYRDHLRTIISVITDRSILNSMEYIIDNWFRSNIYAEDFYFHLRTIIERRFYVLERPDNKYLLEENAKEVVEAIESSDIAKKLIELDVEEENIRNAYEGLDYSKLICKIEEYGNSPQLKKKIRQLGVIEEKLKLFKEMVMIDLGKRENAIMNVANYMEKEKVRYALDEKNKMEID